MQVPSLDPEVLVELASYKMPFGKYQGRDLLSIPEPYLVWLKNHEMPKGRLGMLLETALVVRSHGLEGLVRKTVLGPGRR